MDTVEFERPFGLLPPPRLVTRVSISYDRFKVFLKENVGA